MNSVVQERDAKYPRDNHLFSFVSVRTTSLYSVARTNRVKLVTTQQKRSWRKKRFVGLALNCEIVQQGMTKSCRFEHVALSWQPTGINSDDLRPWVSYIADDSISQLMSEFDPKLLKDKDVQYKLNDVCNVVHEYHNYSFQLVLNDSSNLREKSPVNTVYFWWFFLSHLSIFLQFQTKFLNQIWRLFLSSE